MIRDYQFVSPSLEGLLRHGESLYEGLARPEELSRIMDRPRKDCTVEDLRSAERYFFDLYGLFMKKMANFMLDDAFSNEDEIKLQAMLQEMIKVKKLLKFGTKM